MRKSRQKREESTLEGMKLHLTTFINLHVLPESTHPSLRGVVPGGSGQSSGLAEQSEG